MSPPNSEKLSVAFVTRSIPHYRVAFLKGLETRLKLASIELSVFTGQKESVDDLEEMLSVNLVRNFYFGLGQLLGRRFMDSGRASLRPFYWQPIFWRLLSFDLIIVEQSNSALLNYPLLLHRRLLGRRPKIAFFGHGENLQIRESGLRRWIKITMARNVDFWFGYTELSTDILHRIGVHDDIIRIVNNSTDMNEVKSAGVMDSSSKERMKRELGLGHSPIAVFCAQLRKTRALPFLIESCRAARERISELNLLIIGDGPDGVWIRELAKKENWIRPLGPLYGAEKGKILALSDVFLLPSMVGLSILDSFAAGLPILSARFCNHSPEIAYLKDGVNGLITDASVDAYSAAIVRILSDENMRKSLSSAARKSSDIYSVEAMIENFAQGIEHVLGVKTFGQT